MLYCPAPTAVLTLLLLTTAGVSAATGVAATTVAATAGVAPAIVASTAGVAASVIAAAISTASCQRASSCKLSQAGHSACEACIIVNCHLTALVVLPVVWVVVTLVWPTNQCTNQGDQGRVGVTEVAFVTAATSTNACAVTSACSAY